MFPACSRFILHKSWLLLLVGCPNLVASVEPSMDLSWDQHDPAGLIGNDDSKISVRFYGESQCPYCRKFVEEAWPTIWEDAELMTYVDYDFVAWGNAYFVTSKCSNGGSYDPQERACWYKECIATSSDNDDECFSGKTVYQHSEKEGQVDVYEMCVKLHYGLEVAVDFMYCCEGPNMDNSKYPSAHDLLVKCSVSVDNKVDPEVIQECFESNGHDIEVEAAKQTPTHPGVPYVLVGGEPLKNPFNVQDAICDKLKEHKRNLDTTRSKGNNEVLSLPKACESSRYSSINTPNGMGDILSPFSFLQSK